MSLWRAGVVALVAVAAASCWSPRTTAPSEPVEAPISLAEPPQFSGDGSARFCDRLRLFQDASARLAAGGAPQSYRDLYHGALAAIRDLGEVAPGEIERDIAGISRAYDQLTPALERAQFDLTKIGPGDDAPLRTAEFGEASTRLTAYAQQFCPRTGS